MKKPLKTEHPIYQTWDNMKQRCNNKKHPGYKDYGGRGICICEEWKTDFWQFAKDMGDKPDPTYSLDRINNDGNYEPGNCKWSSKLEQSLNRRNVGKYKRGVYRKNYKTKNPFQAQFEVGGVHYYLGVFATEDEAHNAYREGYKKVHGKYPPK